MNEENKETITPDNNMYIDAINELKANSVSKSDYEQLQSENANLLKALTNNEKLETTATEPVRSAAEIRQNLFTGEHNNLDYWAEALALRDAVLRENKEDIFVPKGHNVTPTDSDYESANKVATIVQECIDFANGDSQLFTNELQRRTVDNNIIRR